MNWNTLNLEEAAQKEKARHEAKSPDQLLTAFKELLQADDALDDEILKRIFKGSDQVEQLDMRQLDPERIYTAEQIESLCIRYRLRFLSARYFKGEIPYEAIAKVKALQKGQPYVQENFKIVAPAPMFNLTEKDKDPLLFLSLGGERYYLIHKWGNDLNMFRRLWVLPFRNFSTLLASVALVALSVVLLMPNSIMMGPYDQNSYALRVIFFFYLFIAFSGLTALYGFSRVKNFNENLWDSRYLD
jgi:hypothetical protein